MTSENYNNDCIFDVDMVKPKIPSYKTYDLGQFDTRDRGVEVYNSLETEGIILIGNRGTGNMPPKVGKKDYILEEVKNMSRADKLSLLKLMLKDIKPEPIPGAIIDSSSSDDDDYYDMCYSNNRLDEDISILKIRETDPSFEPQRRNPESEIDGLFNAIQESFTYHIPLELSVSDFNLAICQGLAQHININSEELRHIFVDHEGKKDLCMMYEPDVIDFNNNDFIENLVDDLVEMIHSNTNSDLKSIFDDDMSTSTHTTKMAAGITLMDSMKNYFSYSAMTLCGIPNIKLVGSNQDWNKLLKKVLYIEEMNSKYDLKIDWWLRHLIPVVNVIVDSAINGVNEDNIKFWKCIYKSVGQSGGPRIYGWINIFYPYDCYNKINESMINNEISEIVEYFNNTNDEFNFRGVNSSYYAMRLSSANVKNKDDNGDYKFISGFLGATITKGRIKPVIGNIIIRK